MWALPLIWLGSATAAYVYSRQVHIPLNLALEALPAFLLEASCWKPVSTMPPESDAGGPGSGDSPRTIVAPALTVSARGGSQFSEGRSTPSMTITSTRPLVAARRSPSCS